MVAHASTEKLLAILEKHRKDKAAPKLVMSSNDTDDPIRA
jgi:hypothetical protein